MKGKQKYTTTPVRVPVDILAVVEKFARETDRNLGMAIKHLVKRGLKAIEEEGSRE